MISWGTVTVVIVILVLSSATSMGFQSWGALSPLICSGGRFIVLESVSPKVSHSPVAQTDSDKTGSHICAVDSISVDAWKRFLLTNRKLRTTVLTNPPALGDLLSGTERLSAFHEDRVESLWNSLRKRSFFKRISLLESDRLKDALRIVYVGLWGQRNTRTQEVSIASALGVASVLGEIGSKQGGGDEFSTVVVAGILSDLIGRLVVDSEAVVLRALESRFGTESIRMAKCYSSLPNPLPRLRHYSDQQVENQLEMLTVLAEDYSSLYIRLADRLHTLRILTSLPVAADVRTSLAEDALQVYSLLAHRMNMMAIRSELEDLAFRELFPREFAVVQSVRDNASLVCSRLQSDIRDMFANDTHLQQNTISYRLSHRVKSAYQVFLKMKRKSLTNPRSVKDLLGVRVIVHAPRRVNESVSDHQRRGDEWCYYVFSKLHDLSHWRVDDDGAKDYLSLARSSSYRSLHSRVRQCSCASVDSGTILTPPQNLTYHSEPCHVDPDNQVEVQIRTRQMHVDAEIGTAAHWHYKDTIFRPDVAASKLYRTAWRSPKQLQEGSFAAVFGLAKQQIRSSRVLVFGADQSTVFNLRKGATALDAAFAIHSQVGLRANAILVNGIDVPFDRGLSHADIILVRAGSDIVANCSWKNWVRTPHALKSLKRFCKQWPSAKMCDS